MQPACEISSDRRLPPGRRILGKIEVPSDHGSEPEVRTGMMEILSQLKLEAGFLNRLLDSAGEAIQRLTALETPAAEYGHIHLLLSGPERAVEDGETWGFFRIEKLEGPAGDEAGSNHSIELYLYAEGE